jgi:VanZ family protein
MSRFIRKLNTYHAMTRSFGDWFPLLAYMASIFTLSSLSLSTAPGQVSYLSYIFHTIEYFILAVLALRAFRETKSPFAYAILFAVLFGISDEVHQLFVPGRTFSFLDICADIAGALLVLVFRQRRMRALIVPQASSSS